MNSWLALPPMGRGMQAFALFAVFVVGTRQHALMTLIHDRISSRHQSAAVLQSKPHNAQDAAAAGFLDRVVGADALLEEARALAAGLAQLPANAYATNKADLRSASLAVMQASLS